MRVIQARLEEGVGIEGRAESDTAYLKKVATKQNLNPESDGSSLSRL